MLTFEYDAFNQLELDSEALVVAAVVFEYPETKVLFAKHASPSRVSMNRLVPDKQ